jgi:hypothetical protein
MPIGDTQITVMPGSKKSAAYLLLSIWHIDRRLTGGCARILRPGYSEATIARLAPVSDRKEMHSTRLVYIFGTERLKRRGNASERPIAHRASSPGGLSQGFDLLKELSILFSESAVQTESSFSRENT